MFDDGFGAFNHTYYYESYHVKKAVREFHEDEEFIDKMLEHELDLSKSADEILLDKYERWGRAASFVVDLVLREIPPHPRKLGRAILKLGRNDGFEWPDGMFMLAAGASVVPEENRENELQPGLFNVEEVVPTVPEELDDEAMRRIEAAAKLFADTKGIKLKESAIPYLGTKVRYDNIYKINPGYERLMRRITPPSLRKGELKEAYKAGFNNGTAQLGIDGLSLADGKEILRRAPRKIRVMPIGESAESVHVLSEHGSRLTLQHPPSAGVDGPIMPITAGSVWARTRAQEVMPPNATGLRGAFEKVLSTLKEKVDKEANF